MSSTIVGRVAAIAALVVAIAVILYFLLFTGPSYTVKTIVPSAGQLVNGNQVKVAGKAVGKVSKIELTDDNRAAIELKISDTFAPLRKGTRLTIRQTSLSGIANRYVQVDLPPENEAGPEMKSGSRIPTDQATPEVALDSIFNTFDAETRRGLKRFTQGLGDLYDGETKTANKGIRYLNPLFGSSRRLFNELNRDEKTLERFIVDTADVFTALSTRQDDISGVVTNLNGTFAALAAEDDNLAEGIGKLPGFMREANTTFVNLRGTLDEVDPLVDASRPAARSLQRLLPELRQFTERAEPVVSDLSTTIRQGGKDNDLIDLLRLQPAIERVALEERERNGEQRQGAFDETKQAVNAVLPQLNQLRPYSSELLGWFDDFGHQGTYDANGGMARIGTVFNAFSVSTPTVGGTGGLLGGLIPVADRGNLFAAQTQTDNRERCPGANERPRDGSTPYTEGGDVNCDPSQLPPGP